jgi:hypothetical protein
MYLLFQKNRLVSRLRIIPNPMSNTFETDTPQAPAPLTMAFWVEKTFETRVRQITAKVAASERLRPRTSWLKKRGLSKHGPAPGDVSAQGSVLRGRFAAPQPEVIGVAAFRRRNSSFPFAAVEPAQKETKKLHKSAAKYLE